MCKNYSTYNVGNKVHSDDEVSDEEEWTSILSIVCLHHDIGIAVES